MEVVTHEELREIITDLGEELRASVAVASANACAPEYYTPGEAAVYLRMSRAQIDRLVLSGELRRAKLGEGKKASVLFRKCDLDEFVERRLECDGKGARKAAGKST